MQNYHEIKYIFDVLGKPQFMNTITIFTCPTIWDNFHLSLLNTSDLIIIIPVKIHLINNGFYVKFLKFAYN